MLTGRPGLLLAIATADCVPILLARRDGGEVAALHVGWRGAQAGIADLSASPACTMCATGADGRHVFHSYRRDRETRTPVADVQWSVIAIAASARLSARPR
jgi:copper oxidase (laccase) domain-containing protein